MRCLGAILLAGITTTLLLPDSLQAKGVRAEATAKLSSQFKKMKNSVYKARMSGCGSWECDEGTVYFQFPDKIEIRYDKPYGSRVISDGTKLNVYNKGGDLLTSTPLEETSLGLMLKGNVAGSVEIASVESIDLGSKAPIRHVYQIELVSTDSESRAVPIQLIFTKKDFRFVGWRSGGNRGFSVLLRDLRPATGKTSALFNAPASL